MNTAIVIAGGSGKRTKQNVPKQFLTVFDKPIIIYTLEALQKCEAIERIVVSCLNGWENFVAVYAKQFGISKLDKIVTAGKERFFSIKNGVDYCRTVGRERDVVVLIDANRPLLSSALIENAVKKAAATGSVLTVLPCVDSMFEIRDGVRAERNLDRGILFRGVTPEAFQLKKIARLCTAAMEKGLTGMSISSIAIELGENISVLEGSPQCFKITTAEDIELFKAVVASKPLIYLKKTGQS